MTFGDIGVILGQRNLIVPEGHVPGAFGPADRQDHLLAVHAPGAHDIERVGGLAGIGDRTVDDESAVGAELRRAIAGAHHAVVHELDEFPDSGEVAVGRLVVVTTAPHEGERAEDDPPLPGLRHHGRAS